MEEANEVLRGQMWANLMSFESIVLKKTNEVLRVYIQGTVANDDVQGVPPQH